MITGKSSGEVTIVPEGWEGASESNQTFTTCLDFSDSGHLSFLDSKMSSFKSDGCLKLWNFAGCFLSSYKVEAPGTDEESEKETWFRSKLTRSVSLCNPGFA